MKALIIYDSTFGNTKRIAESIAKGFGHDILAIPVATVSWHMLDGIDVLIVGSPTQGGRPTKNIQEFINTIPDKGLQGVRIAGFDTRFKESEQNFALRLLIKTIKYAAEKITASLASKGGMNVVAEGFFVTGKEGPLVEGEPDRAEKWGASLLQSLKK
ncbi:MAG: flavodoxin family protein [Patescibacteria group bacterium]|jgi:flavodoxin